MKERKLFVLPCLFVLAVAAMIFCLSTGSFSAEATGRVLGHFNHFGRKLAHMSEYALLFLVLRFALAKLMSGYKTANVVLLSLLLCVLFAASDEWHQSFVPNRTASLGDVIYDTTGALIAASLFCSYRFFRSKKQSSLTAC